MSDHVYATRIKIQNILGVDELEFKPGKVTVISGKNEEGKTSVLRAIQSIVKGGSDAKLVRKGATAGEVVIVLDNGFELRERANPNGSSLSVSDPKVGTIGKAKGYVDRLTSLECINPLRLCAAKPPERRQMVLESIDFKIDKNAIESIVRSAGTAAPELLRWEAPTLTIETVDKALDRVVKARQDVGRVGKEIAQAIVGFKAALPKGVDTATARAELEALEKHKEHLLETKRLSLQAIASDWNVVKAEATAQALSAVDALSKECEEKTAEDARISGIENFDLKQKIDDINRMYELKLRELRKEADESITSAQIAMEEMRSKRKQELRDVAVRLETTEKTAQQARKSAIDAGEQIRTLKEKETESICSAALADLNAKVEVAKRGIEDNARATQLEAMIAEHEKRLVAAREAYKAADTAASAIEQMKIDALSKIPIEGLSLGDDDLAYKGVPFTTLSGAQQLEVAFAVAAHGLGDLRLVCVDGLEALDSDRFAKVVDLAKQMDVQLIGTKVTDEEFTIRTI